MITLYIEIEKRQFLFFFKRIPTKYRSDHPYFVHDCLRKKHRQNWIKNKKITFEIWNRFSVKCWKDIWSCYWSRQFLSLTFCTSKLCKYLERPFQFESERCSKVTFYVRLKLIGILTDELALLMFCGKDEVRFLKQLQE